MKKTLRFIWEVIVEATFSVILMIGIILMLMFILVMGLLVAIMALLMGTLEPKADEIEYIEITQEKKDEHTTQG